ncbi:MAG: hypothetical protein R2739_08320 [Chitinophagales bacterium]|nr:hypothetical protein [Bacteroidota bacterium]
MKTNLKFLPVVIVIISLAFAGIGIFSIYSGTGISDKEKVKIIQTGIPCEATLLSIDRTGNIVNNIHQYKFKFNITDSTNYTFIYTEKKLIDPIYMSSIKIGMKIPAFYNKENKEEVAILWKKVGIGNAF